MLGPFLFKKPWVAGLIILALLIPAALQIPNVEFASLRVFQNDRREAQKLLDAVGRRFVPEDILIAAYESPDVFRPKSLALDRVLTRELQAMRVPISDSKTASIAFDVLSLTNVKDAFGTNTAFSMHPLIEEPIPTDLQSIERTRERAHANPLIAANLVSKDDHVAAIMIRVNPFLDDAALVRAVDLIQARLETIEAETGTPFYLMGHAVTEAEFQTYALRDLVRYTPVTAIVALLLCFAFTFSSWSTFALGTIVLVSDIVALGIMPLIGYKYSPLSVAIAPASIILATSTVVHFMGEAGNALYGEHRSWEVVRVQVFREVLRPSFMCCLFTAIGFFSVYVSDVQAIREFGVSAAIVTGTTFVITVLGVALWWTWWPVELFVRRGSPAVSSGFQNSLSKFAAMIIHHPVRALAATMVVLGVVGAGLYDLEINENALEYYPKDSPVRVANDFIEENLAGTEAFAVVIEKRDPGAFTDPRELAKLDQFAAELRVLAEAEVVETVADQIKLMRQAVFGEDPREARIPDTEQQVRTLLAISGEERVHELLDKERRAVRISARTKIHGTKPLAAVFAKIEARLEQLYPAAEGHHTQIVGISKVFVETTDLIARAEIESLALTCIAIIGLLMIMMRSVSVGFLTILPNTIPLLMVMGFMGWTGKPITVGNSMLCSIAFGVAVEDTIHLIEGYRERLRMGYSIEEAADYAFRVKAPAGIWTSIVLAAGFLAIGFASFQPVSDFGLLLSLAVITSLLGNLIILPATILLFRSRAGIKEQSGEPEQLLTAASTAAIALIILTTASTAFAKPSLDPKLKGFDPTDRDAAFERPPEGCLDMDDPRAKNPDDPRRLKYGVKICCLDPADPRAQNPDEERFKKYGIEMCCLKPEHPWAKNPDDPRIKKWGVKMCCIPPEHPWAQNPDDPRMKKHKIDLCCIPPEHPWAQNPNDPRIKQFNVKLCCLKPDHPWAKDPHDPRRKSWKVDLCGPDIKALTHQSNLRHFLKEELTDVQLVMVGKDGAKQTQIGRMARTQDAKLDEEKLWYHFLAPSDIKGLTLLTLDTRKDGTQQWLYLPAFGKVRRLGAADLKEQFGATDYIYEDLKRHVPDDYEYLFLEMQGAGTPDESYVFQATPRPDGMAKDSPYGKLKVWLRKSDLFVIRVQEFDRKLEPWKELRFEEIVEVAPGGVKRSNRIICMDIKRKHQTAVITTSRKINQGSILSSWLNPATFHLE